MPRFRATISGPDLDAVDGKLRDARVGVVVSRDVDDATTPAAIPNEEPTTESVDASIDAESAEEASQKVSEALGEGYSVDVIDG